jgi:hypothetical protein
MKSESKNSEFVEMIKQLHRDNSHDTVMGIREDSEFIALKKIHERNKIIDMILKEVKL